MCDYHHCDNDFVLFLFFLFFFFFKFCVDLNNQMLSMKLISLNSSRICIKAIMRTFCTFIPNLNEVANESSCL